VVRGRDHAKESTGVIVAGALVVLSAASFPLASPAAVSAVAGPDGKTNPHQQTNRTEEKRRQAKRDVAQKVITGKAEVRQRGKSRSVQVTPGKWVEYGTEEARTLTFLMDHGTSGPVHSSIPEPAEDNNPTYWIPDFSREVSSGRCGVSGDVTDWIPLPTSGSAYAGDTTKTLQDAADVW